MYYFDILIEHIFTILLKLFLSFSNCMESECTSSKRELRRTKQQPRPLLIEIDEASVNAFDNDLVTNIF